MCFVLYYERMQGDGRSWKFRYMGDGGKEVSTALRAEVYEDRDVALAKASGASIKCNFRVSWVVMKLSPTACKSIEKHKLKVRGAQVFNLPVNTPARYMADRFEDEGMTAEATVLRN